MDATTETAITVIAVVVIGLMLITYGFQKLAENISYGWHAGRLQAEREHQDKLDNE